MHDKKKMILPPIVLAVVCALCCGLLAVAKYWFISSAICRVVLRSSSVKGTTSRRFVSQ